MEARPLGNSRHKVPVVGMGTWKTMDVQDPESRRAVVDAALASGTTLFDSSPMYGHAERALGTLLEGRRERALVATKVWTHDDREADAQIERALAWFGGRVDVYQVHNLVAFEKRLATLEKLRDAGRVRVVGATHWSHASFDELARAMRAGRLGMVQLPLSVADRAAERELLPLAESLSLGVLVMEPLGTGSLVRAPKGFDPARFEPYGVRTWPQVALKWILSDPRVTAVLPATTSPQHARENAVAGEPPWFEASERERVARLVG